MEIKIRYKCSCENGIRYCRCEPACDFNEFCTFCKDGYIEEWKNANDVLLEMINHECCC